jgi:hypothetical protein
MVSFGMFLSIREANGEYQAFYCEVFAMERELEDARKSIGSWRVSKSSLLLEVKLFEFTCVTIPPIPFTGLP